MLRVNRLAAAIDMIAAGTSAPMPMAANATPANQLGNISWNSTGTTVLPSGFADRRHPGRDGHEAQQPHQPEHEGVDRQRAMFRLSMSRLLAASTPVMRVRVEEQRERRAERQRRVPSWPGPAAAHPRRVGSRRTSPPRHRRSTSQPPSFTGMTITAMMT